MDECDADLTDQRHRLVDVLERIGHLTNPRVARALRDVPRHIFLQNRQAGRAYEDAPVDIGHGQTISAPHMVALMLDAGALQPGERVLEVGGGSGYLAAVASALVRPGGSVTAIEIVPELAEVSRHNLEDAGCADAVRVVVGDGSLGEPSGAPYDAVFVSAAAPRVPPPLMEQLEPSRGRIVIPLGGRDDQTLCRVALGADRTPIVAALHGCRFVPMRGRYGWP